MESQSPHDDIRTLIAAYAASCEGSTVMLPDKSFRNMVDMLLIGMAHAIVMTGRAAQGMDLRQFDFLGELARPGNTRDMATIIMGSIYATGPKECREIGILLIDEIRRQRQAMEVMQ